MRLSTGGLSVLAEYEVDDDLMLLFARSEGIPRLGIHNLNNDKKKYVPFSFVENPGRVLKIKVGRSNKEYRVSDIMEGVSSVIKNSGEAIKLNSLVWRGVQVLSDLAHVPRTARSDADLNIITENKKDTLWYAYTPKRGKWRVRPCFAFASAEHAVMSAVLEEGKPWPAPALSIENGALPSTMRNAPLVKELARVNPARWSEFMLPVSKAMLLGFSDWSGGGEHLFGNALWKYLPKENYRSEETISAVSSAGRLFMNRITAYLRLWPILETIKSEQSHDALKELGERGMKKRERFEMTAPNLDDKRFRVTRLADENTSAVAFGIEPVTRLPGEQDRVLTLAGDVWETCLDTCSMGGERDPRYACNSIISAIETKNWYKRIVECLTWAPKADGDEL
ncbi:MAG: hypothetical protein LBE65_03910 [Synergistaceae bacterium]|jgi:hypothetical protein|nr:hypothetical protein [Synergistaceae bacterium]